MIGHSIGVTLAAQQIIKLNKSSQIDTFVGVTGVHSSKIPNEIASYTLCIRSFWCIDEYGK